MKRGPIQYLFALCGKAILFFFLFEQYKETTYLLRFLDSVHGGCQYCLVFPMGTWESEIPGLVPSFSAPCVTCRDHETTLKTQFICLRNWAPLSFFPSLPPSLSFFLSFGLWEQGSTSLLPAPKAFAQMVWERASPGLS